MGGVPRERARRQAILARVAANRAKVGRAQERCHVSFPVGHELHAETCESGMIAHHCRIDPGFVELEHRWVVDDFAGLTVDDLIQMHRLRKSPSTWQKWRE